MRSNEAAHFCATVVAAADWAVDDMGFRTIRTTVLTRCTSIATPASDALCRVLSNVAVVDVLRGFYKANPMLKVFWHDFIERILLMLDEPDEAYRGNIEEHELVRLILHVVDQVRAHTHSTNLEVRSWARASEALHEDQEALRVCATTFCRATVEDARMHSALRLSLTGTLSTCLSTGHVVLPFEG
jgi:hypothetical protein